MEKSKHFVLVHGGGFGAWCWYKVKTLLEEAGQKVTAFDLAGQGRNLTRLNELQTINDYHEPLFSYMASLSSKDNKVILVGHSYGGYAVSSAMERFPYKISLAVFVTANMVGPHFTAQQIEDKMSNLYTPEFYKDSEVIIHDNENVDIFAGSNFLAQNISIFTVGGVRVFQGKMSKIELLVSNERYGSIPRAYFIALEDRTIGVELQYWMVENSPPNEVRKIIGANHMVMFSKP
ncbi:hypothetical protein M9H77_09325 [Catharanthus roseus]|uniref:Uncharacterized protein n=1 Tax=Catharanthus roseus TaxID=4058 RepID=A0ACC0C0G2_CATRO|nr:hypothetical protein M9H77_09325 [Catharanthus roseus]